MKIGPTALSQSLHKLVEAGYLKSSTVLSHLSPRDKRIRYEAEEKKKISGFPTAKELREAREVAEARLKREEEEAEQVGMVGIHFVHMYIEGGSSRLQKRKARDYSHKASKVRSYSA